MDARTLNNVQQQIARLQCTGWTLAALADELGNHVNTLEKWKAGDRYPANSPSVIAALNALTKRKLVPKRRRHSK